MPPSGIATRWNARRADPAWCERSSSFRPYGCLPGAGFPYTLTTLLRGPDGWFHTAALRCRRHPRDADFSSRVIAKAQAPDTGCDDPRLEHGVHRPLGREYRAPLRPAGAACGCGTDAMDRQRLPAA